MNSAEDVVGTSRRKWAYLVRIVPRKSLVDDGCAALLFEDGRVIRPGAILNDVDCARVINKIERSAFLNSDRGLHKITIAHVYIVAITSAIVPPATT